VSKFKIISVLIGLAFLVSTGWQFAGCELANYELRDDLRDIGSLLGTRVGMTDVKSDEDLRQAVIRKAAEHNIVLEPQQVTVERSGTSEAPAIYISADYTVRVDLPGKTFLLHFTPTNRP
jgi:hypothetical protein